MLGSERFYKFVCGQNGVGGCHPQLDDGCHPPAGVDRTLMRPAAVCGVGWKQLIQQVQ